MGPVNFILESKASALGINTTVISKTDNDKKHPKAKALDSKISTLNSHFPIKFNFLISQYICYH